MPFIPSDPLLSVLKDREFRVSEMIRFFSDTPGYDQQVFDIPEGFVTDLASIPRPFWAILPPFGSYTLPSILHDWLWRSARGFVEGPIVDDVDIDGLFRKAMKDQGTSFFVRWVIWGHVRIAAIFGGRSGSMETVHWFQLLASFVLPWLVILFTVFCLVGLLFGV